MKNSPQKSITTIILIVFISSLNIYCKNDDDNILNDSVRINYSKIIDGLKNYYVIDIPFTLYGSHYDDVIDEITDLNKTYKDYQTDSIAFYQSIANIYESDYRFVQYIEKFRNDCGHEISFEFFDKRNCSYISQISEKRMKDMIYYRIMYNNALTIILNYYLNSQHNTIKLLLDAVYIDNHSIKTEQLYKKLDKIFKKYGYEDKEKIREAILKDFGKCIDYTQLPAE